MSSAWSLYFLSFLLVVREDPQILRIHWDTQLIAVEVAPKASIRQDVVYGIRRRLKPSM